MINEMSTTTLLKKNAHPALSIILPAHPAYPNHKLDKEAIKNKVKEAEKLLHDSYYDDSKVKQLITELHKAVKSIDYSELSQGIGIFAAPGYHKVVHLSFSPEEKLLIDRSFEIRDLLYAVSRTPAYVVVSISANGTRVFEGHEKQISEKRLKGAPANADKMKGDGHSKVANFTDSANLKEITLDKYLRKIDETITENYAGAEKLVIIAGSQKILAALKEITFNKIAGWIEGNFDHATVDEVKKAAAPLVAAAIREIENKALHNLEEAAGQGRTASGIGEVWRSAGEGRVMELLVEKSYKSSGHWTTDRLTFVADNVYDASSPVADAVDEVIEMVIDKGGKVVFLDNGTLEQHQHIAAILRY